MQVECREGVAGAAVEERGDDVVLVLRSGALEPGELRAVRDVLARVHGRLVGVPAMAAGVLRGAHVWF